MVLANGNYTDYKMKTEESRRKDLNLQTKFSYAILPTLKTNLDYSYRSLTGRGIEMNIHTSKFEITTQVKRLYISAGVEVYWSKSSYTNSKYKGAFIQITRNF